MEQCTGVNAPTLSASQGHEEEKQAATPAASAIEYGHTAEPCLSTPTSLPTEHRAGFWLRFIAFAIDCAVLGGFSLLLLLCGFLSANAGATWSGLSPDASRSFSLVSLWLVGVFMAAAAYFTILHSEYGQTIGKSLLGLEVRSKERDLLNYSQALLRVLAYGISASFCGLGFLVIAFTSGKRAWHDVLVGSVVVARQYQEQ